MIILGLSIRLSINDWRINNKKYIEFYLYLSLFYKYYFIDELNNRIYKKNEKSNVKLCYYGMVSKYKAKFMLIYANLTYKNSLIKNIYIFLTYNSILYFQKNI